MTVISLFEKWQTTHEHFNNETDALQELWIILLSARYSYRKEVLNDGKKLDRFVEDFACSHRHVNCDKARCRNVHEKNHNIARRILTERGDLAQHLFNSENFTLKNCIKMKHVFDTTDAPPPNTVLSNTEVSETKPPLSFGYHLSLKQMVRIADCANANHLFCVSVATVEDIRALLERRNGYQITVENIRSVTILFDTLLENGMIGWNWKAAMARGGHLLSKKTGKPISATTLSSALSEIKNRPTPVSKRIVDEIREIAIMRDDNEAE